MARNRKRARDRRSTRPADAAGLATAAGGDVEAPEPLAHATPDAELAEAQLALGRPELSEVPSEAELDAVEAAEQGEEGDGRAGRLVAPSGTAVEPRASAPARLANFLRGSWRELQRVQWPDRRQTMQATGVVIGFVIVAGVFLGVADLVAQKLVNFILK